MFPHETGSSTSSGANSPAPGSGSSLRTRTLMAGAGGRPATYGSRTLILDPTETYEEGAEDDEQDDDERHVVGVLHVEGATRPQRRIQWSEEVVDNEHLGRKKSKICCIFKKTREFGESSDESSSDSSSDDSSSDESDSGGPNLDRGPSRPARKSHDHGHDHDHNEGDECGHHHHHEHGRMKKKKKPVLNSYERMPKVKPSAPQPINQPSPDAPSTK